MQSRRFDFREIGDALLCACRDRVLIDATTCQQWGDDLFALVDEENRSRIVISFHGVTFLASSFMNKLLILERKITAKKGMLVLQGLAPEIYEVFVITRMNQLFRFAPDDAGSLRILGSPVPA